MYRFSFCNFFSKDIISKTRILIFTDKNKRIKIKKDFEKEFYDREYSKIIFSKRKMFNFLLLW